MRLLSKEPADRPASAREVAEALRHNRNGAADGDGPSCPAYDLTGRDDRHRSRPHRRDRARRNLVQAAAPSMDVQVRHFDYAGFFALAAVALWQFYPGRAINPAGPPLTTAHHHEGGPD